MRGYQNDLFSYDQAHEKLTSTGTTKSTATRKLNQIKREKGQVQMLEERIHDSLPSDVEPREE